MKKIYSNLKTALLTLCTTFTLVSNAQTVTLGSGTTSGGSTSPGPINEYYRSSHCQILYTASEISAAGGVSSLMSQFGFNISSGGGVTYALPNFTIKMKNTPAPDASVYDGVGLTTVYNTASYSPTPGGFQLLTLSTPFFWNGVDNILVDVCFDQVNPTYSSSGIVMLYAVNVNNSFIYVRMDTSPQCGVACTNILSTKPQAQMVFLPPPPLDLGVNTFLKPRASKKCYGNDTIRARVYNYGSGPIDFSVNNATVTVKSTGPNVSTYSLGITSGSLAVGAYLDTTITNNYNMNGPGTYNLKGYTTVVGDGQALNDTIRTSLVRKPFFTITASPNDSVCLGTPVQLNTILTPSQIGSGTYTNPSYQYPAPYGNYFDGAKHQFLFLASELTAAGLVAGNINSAAFNVANLNNSGSLTNFNMSIGSTTLTALTATIQGGLTQVYSSTSYTPTLGINTHTFTTPYVWNGTDNILLQTCFYNTTNNNNASFYQTTLPFNASAWIKSNTIPTLCSSSGGGASLSTNRPNVYFGESIPTSYAWTPGSTLTATNIANPIANVPGTTVFTLTVDYTAQNCSTYDTMRIFIKQTPTLNLGHDTTVCTPSYLLNGGTNASTFQWSTGDSTNTISVSNTGTYMATATSSVGCVKKDTVHVTFNSKPIVTLGHDTAFCQGSYVELNAGNPGTSHTWGKVGGGFSATTQTVNINTPGTYYAVVTTSLSTSCTSRDTVVVSSKSLPNVSLVFNAPPTLLCQFSAPRALNEGSPAGGTYIGPGVNGNSFDPALVGPGTYVILYSYTGPNSCTNQAEDTLRVKGCVGIEEYGDNATLNIYPNPTKGDFTIAISSNTDLNAAIQILSIDGRVVYEDHLSTSGGLYEKQVNISNLADGIYYLKMQSSQATKTYKILKQ